MTPFTIVLADDHVILRQGLKRIIEGAPDMEVIGEADDGLELVRLLQRVPCDLVILDISMPRLRGIEAIPEVKGIQPHLKVLVLTMHRELELLNAALSAGANGYVLKEDADTQLFAAIGKIRKGMTYVSPKLADEMTHDWATACRTDAGPAPDANRLTLRERQILKLTAEGHSSREISGLLCISARTVEHHRAHIMSKLRLRKTADVVRYALSGGYL
jgi:two-component system, NarL family, response regulator NreC